MTLVRSLYSSFTYKKFKIFTVNKSFTGRENVTVKVDHFATEKIHEL